MSGITMCVGTGCPIRSTCRRYMSEIEEFQSFADFTSLWHHDNENLEPECPQYIEWAQP